MASLAAQSIGGVTSASPKVLSGSGRTTTSNAAVGGVRRAGVGLGNAPTTPAVIEALAARRDHASALVREHVLWALARHAC